MIWDLADSGRFPKEIGPERAIGDTSYDVAIGIIREISQNKLWNRDLGEVLDFDSGIAI